MTPPAFTLLGEKPAATGRFRVLLDVPQGMDQQYFQAALTLGDGTTIVRQLSEEGLELELEPGRRVTRVQFRLSVYDLESDTFALSGGSASEARFAFTANDLGKVAFAGQPLALEGGALVMERLDRVIRFRATEGGCKP